MERKKLHWMQIVLVVIAITVSGGLTAGVIWQGADKQKGKSFVYKMQHNIKPISGRFEELKKPLMGKELNREQIVKSIQAHAPMLQRETAVELSRMYSATEPKPLSPLKMRYITVLNYLHSISQNELPVIAAIAAKERVTKDEAAMFQQFVQRIAQGEQQIVAPFKAEFDLMINEYKVQRL